jgi:cardiolipin synthase (CMP-forming)
VGSPADQAAVTPRDTERRSFDTDRVLTLPNLLSLLRLAGVPLMLWLILGPQADILAVVVLTAAGITDYLDGFLARRWHQRSRLGQLLDPAADRLYILATLVGLGLRQLVPWWLVAVLVTRDCVIALLVPVLKTRGYSTLPVHFLGKAATFSLLYAFPCILLGSSPAGWAFPFRVFGWAFALWGTALYWYAALLYLRQAYELVRSTPPLRPRHRDPLETPNPPRG